MKTSVMEVHAMLAVLSVDEVEKRIGEVPGVESVTVNCAAGNATVRYDETRLAVADIKSAVRQRGYAPAANPAPRSTARSSTPDAAAAAPVVRDPGDVRPVADLRAPARGEARPEAARDGGGDVNGMTAAEVAAARAQHGPNRLPEPEPKSLWRRLLGQLASPLVLTLLGAAAITVFVGLRTGSAEPPLQRFGDAIAILLIVLLNAALGLFQERRAEAALHALKTMTTPPARVVRDGKTSTVSADEIVPGDLLEIEAGDAIAADARLVEAVDLAIDEAALTGESTATAKDARAGEATNASLAERQGTVFMGTMAVRGRGRAIVTATGARTELGRIGSMIAAAVTPPTRLEKLLETFGRRVLYACLALSAILFVWGLVHPALVVGVEARPWHVLLLEAVSLAVAAIPEGLPAITTITLALGTQRMAKHGAIVRRLPAVETLGAATVICTDKTGTLTQNLMMVREVWTADRAYTVTGEGFDPAGAIVADATTVARDAAPPVLARVLRTAALCNAAALERGADGKWKVAGDPTEGALLVLAARGGVERASLVASTPIVREIPFDSDRKRMTVVARPPDGQAVAYVKGSVDVLLPRCSSIATGDGARAMTDADRALIHGETEKMGERALRVLALCDGTAGTAEGGDPERELTFLGVVGMMDPPREGVQDALRRCREAGIRVAMITGDHKVTAMAIAREIGLWEEGDEAITATELEALSDEELAARVDRIRVFARTSPEQKLRIVRAFKLAHHIVAMTGDGVNDAPALKEAHIGIAMGKSGTEVARQAADIVLADDDFVTIVDAVHEGRAIFRNIQKFVFFLLSSNAGLALAVFAISFSGSWLPLTPLMILWINLVTNGLPALALGIDPPDPNQMVERPLRANEPLFGGRDLLGLVFVGVVMAAGALAMYAWNWCEHGSGPQGPRTLAFMVLALGPLLHAWSCRSPSLSIVRARPLVSLPLLLAVVLSGTIQLVAVLIPSLRPVFRTDALTTHDWIMVAVAAFAIVPAVELAKAVARAHHGGDRGRREPVPLEAPLRGAGP